MTRIRYFAAVTAVGLLASGAAMATTMNSDKTGNTNPAGMTSDNGASSDSDNGYGDASGTSSQAQRRADRNQSYNSYDPSAGDSNYRAGDAEGSTPANSGSDTSSTNARYNGNQ